MKFWRSREESFWRWFSANSARLSNFELDQEAVFAELDQQLHRVHPALTFEFGPRNNGQREFIISADGDKAGFPAVRHLASEAPHLPDWQIVPFRPPKNLGVYRKIRMGGRELSVDDIWFRPEVEGEKVHLELFVRGLSEKSDDFLDSASFLLLDIALGEFVVETRIGGISRLPLPDDPAAQGLRPFTELPSVLNLSVH